MLGYKSRALSPSSTDLLKQQEIGGGSQSTHGFAADISY